MAITYYVGRLDVVTPNSDQRFCHTLSVSTVLFQVA